MRRIAVKRGIGHNDGEHATTLRMQRTLLSVSGVLIALVALAACHGHHDEEGPSVDEYFYSCESAPDGGATTFATDESFAAFVNKESANAVVKDDSKAARLVIPVAGATLSVATPPQFSFSVAVAGMSRSAPGHFAAACLRPARPGRLARWLAFEGTAWAHCGAVSGENFLLRVIDGGATVYSAMLSVTSFSPTAAAWTKAMSGRSGHTVTISIERATLLKGDISAGPFAPVAAPTFLLGP